MITINPTLNPLEVLVVAEKMKERGVESYSLLPGNNCIWSHYGYINEYWIFDKGRLVDVQID